MAKIQIQIEGGFYETEINDKPTVEEILDIVEKLKEVYRFLSPMIKKKEDEWDDSYLNVAVRASETRRPNSIRTWCDTKDKAIKILWLHYFGSKEEKQNFAKENDIVWDNVSKSIYNLKKRYDIKAEDVDMQRFPKNGEQWQSNVLLKRKFENDNVKDDKPKLYAMSELSNKSWDTLKVICDQFGVKDFDKYKTLDDKEVLITEIRKKMRIIENQNGK